MKLTELVITIVVALGLGGGAYLVGHRDGRLGCEQRVQKAVDKQKVEDEKQIIALAGRLVVIEQQKADGDKEVADYARRLAEQAATQPNESGCVLTKGDADEINRR